MELQKKEDWELEDDEVAYEGRTKEYSIRVFVGVKYEEFVVIVDMPHQCDNWEIAEQDLIRPIGNVRQDVATFMAELAEVQNFLHSDRYEEIIKEVKGGR